MVRVCTKRRGAPSDKNDLKSSSNAITAPGVDPTAMLCTLLMIGSEYVPLGSVEQML